MDLAAAIERISEMAGQNDNAYILPVKHKGGENELTFLITRDQKGGMVAQDVTKTLETFDPHPARRRGVATHQTLDSLIAHVNRTKNANSALFGRRCEDSLGIRAVINYDDAVNDENGNPVADALPQHGDHIAVHRFPLSDEIKAWSTIAGEPLDLLEFALFLEDNILDVMPLPGFLTGSEKPDSEADIKLKDLVNKLDGNPCGPENLMGLSKGLQINEDTKARAFIDRNTGEQAIGFESEHQDAEGNKLVVPNMFLVAIPVFEGGAPYRIPVRLRYRKKSGALAWLIEPYQIEKYIKHAFTEACERAAEETGLPLFFGEPET